MIIKSKYESPFPIKNGHVETIIPHVLRIAEKPNFKRERIATPDQDFLDLDWSASGEKALVILSHGLEGSSESTYIRSATSELRRSGYDVLSWNCRGCSGEPNRLLRSYHSGVSDDLKTVIGYVLKNYKYESLYLVGFSMGGNITLKYLGEEEDRVPGQIRAGIAISSPISLGDCAASLSDNMMGRIYTRKFIVTLVEKLREKQAILPDMNLDIKALNKIWDFKSFDDAVTAPINGFGQAEVYWQECSSYKVLENIRTPSLALSAKNDPFLSGDCYPYDKAKDHTYFQLEVPRHGGHVGFSQNLRLKDYWMNERILEFMTSV